MAAATPEAAAELPRTDEPEFTVSETPLSLLAPAVDPARLDLHSILMHGVSQPGTEPGTTLIGEPGGAPALWLQGAASLQGVKLSLCSFSGPPAEGCVSFLDRVPVTHEELSVSWELHTMPNGSAVTLLLSAFGSPRGGDWLVIPSDIQQHQVGSTPRLPPCSIAVQLHRLAIDRPVLEVSVWASSAAGQTLTCLQARVTTPEPCHVQVQRAGDDAVISFADIFMRRVQCPILRAGRAFEHCLPQWAAGARAGSWAVSMFGHACSSGLSGTQVAPGIVQDGHSTKPWLCPDGRRFATEVNAKRWLAKAAAAAKADASKGVGPPPSSTDANAVLTEMVSRDAAAAAHDATEAATSGIHGAITTTQLSVHAGPAAHRNWQPQGLVECLVWSALRRSVGKMQASCSALVRVLEEANAPASTAVPAVAATAIPGTRLSSAEYSAFLESPGLWSAGACPESLQSTISLLQHVAAGGMLSTDATGLMRSKAGLKQVKVAKA